jgi:hypothetical protein
MEVKKEYQVKISNRFPPMENLDVDINKASESITDIQKLWPRTA